MNKTRPWTVMQRILIVVGLVAAVAAIVATCIYIKNVGGLTEALENLKTIGSDGAVTE